MSPITNPKQNTRMISMSMSMSVAVHEVGALWAYISEKYAAPGVGEETQLLVPLLRKSLLSSGLFSQQLTNKRN